MKRPAPADAAARASLVRWFEEGLAAVSASRRLPESLPAPPEGRTVVVGAGKAAAAMAKTAEECWNGALGGVVVVPRGHALPCRRIEVVEAAHPVPDESCERAARRVLAAVRGLGPQDLVLCLLSGGGSSLLALPAPGVILEEKRAVTRALIAAGAPVHEINCVRKHLSAIKGGRLALACSPAQIAARAVSDVVGDEPHVIASGPVHPDPTTFADALAVLERYGVPAPDTVLARFRRSEDETPKPGDPRLPAVDWRIVAAGRDALAAAAEAARAEGVTPVVLGDGAEGDSRLLARAHADIVRRVVANGEPAAPPCVLLSGGETTVRVRGAGSGGPNSEYLLALALALGGRRSVYALAADTDGIDGSGEAAGALLFPDTLARAAEQELDARAFLAANDSQGFFGRLGDLLLTGPTLTNVNDFRAILVRERTEEPLAGARMDR